jgi:hypothetical protein
MNVVYVSRYLGHSSPEVTLRVYAKLLDSVEQDAEAAQVTVSIGSVKVLENSGGERLRSDESLEVRNRASLAEYASGGD